MILSINMHIDNQKYDARRKLCIIGMDELVIRFCPFFVITNPHIEALSLIYIQKEACIANVAFDGLTDLED